jgi:hypothetical protein
MFSLSPRFGMDKGEAAYATARLSFRLPAR